MIGLPRATRERRPSLASPQDSLTNLIGLLAGRPGLASAAETSRDVGILNVALGLEHQAIGAYQLGAGSGLLQKSTLEVAMLFQAHHKAHRDALIATDRPSGMARWRERLFAWMRRNEARATAFYRIPPSRAIEFGIQVEI